MNDAMIGLVCQFVLAVIFGGALLMLALVFSRRAGGNEVVGDMDLPRAQQRIRDLCSKKFLIAILFLPYVICAALLYPWAVALNEAMTGGNWLWILCWGLVLAFFAMISMFYIWGRGLLKGGSA